VKKAKNITKEEQMGDKGKKDKDKHSKQVDIAKNEANKKKQEQAHKQPWVSDYLTA